MASGFFSASSDFRTLYGRRWYYSLTALLAVLKRQKKVPTLIIRRDYETESENSHLFTHFTDPYSLWDCLTDASPLERGFHEIPLCNQIQKLRFDLDLEGVNISDAELWCISTVHAIYIVLANYDVTINISRDIIICTSHGKLLKPKIGPFGPCEHKFSYHIIVDNYACFNREDFAIIFGKIRELVKTMLHDKWIEEFFDKSLPDENHSLRILGAWRTGRPKKWEASWPFTIQNQRVIINTAFTDEPNSNIPPLKASLLTWTGYCRIINLPVQEIPEGPELRELELQDDIIQEAEKWLKQLGLEQVFKIAGKKGGIISLLRKEKKETRCPICDRKHSSDNAYFSVYAIVGAVPRVTFKCHRDRSKGLTICQDASNWIVSEMSESGLCYSTTVSQTDITAPDSNYPTTMVAPAQVPISASNYLTKTIIPSSISFYEPEVLDIEEKINRMTQGHGWCD